MNSLAITAILNPNCLPSSSRRRSDTAQLITHQLFIELFTAKAYSRNKRDELSTDIRL